MDKNSIRVFPFAQKIVAGALPIVLATTLVGCANTETKQESENLVMNEQPEDMAPQNQEMTEDEKVEEFMQATNDVYDAIIFSIQPENLKDTGGKALDVATDGFIYLVDLVNGEETVMGYNLQDLPDDAALAAQAIISRAEENLTWAYGYVQEGIDTNYPDLWDNVETKKQVAMDKAGELKLKFDEKMDSLETKMVDKYGEETVEAVKETASDTKANAVELWGLVKEGASKGAGWIKENAPEILDTGKEYVSKGWGWVTDKAEELEEKRTLGK